MNERIQELAEQAGFDLTPTANMLHTVRGNHTQLGRFAELIVRECADIADINAHQHESPGAYVRQHFGVE